MINSISRSFKTPLSIFSKNPENATLNRRFGNTYPPLYLSNNDRFDTLTLRLNGQKL